jgi:hypothetical protein
MLLGRAATGSRLKWTHRANIEGLRGMCALVAGRIDVAAKQAVTMLALAEQGAHVDLLAHALELAAYAELAEGRLAIAQELFQRLESVSREHEIDNIRDAFTGLAIVTVLTGDPSTARRCRTELQRRPERFATMAAYRYLACGYTYLADGDTSRAQAAVDHATAIANNLGQRYARILAVELAAAITANDDAEQTRRYLAMADRERHTIGASPWPLQPYRHTAELRLQTT